MTVYMVTSERNDGQQAHDIFKTESKARAFVHDEISKVTMNRENVYVHHPAKGVAEVRWCDDGFEDYRYDYDLLACFYITEKEVK